MNLRENVMSASTPSELRAIIRAGLHRGHTVGLAPEYAQGNLAILPQSLAADFIQFAYLNPQACPVIAIGAPGARAIAETGTTDICTELPAYYVYKNGELAAEVHDINEYWRDDLVTFVIGCSYSFEGELLKYDVPLRHMEESHEVPMFVTNIPNRKAGPFGGNMVVSMRPMKARDAIRAVQVTTRFPRVHGAPVHIGDPSLIGIADIRKPEYGLPSTIRDDEIPVFWACGVTPQQAIKCARPGLAIAHKPGHMLLTDIKNSHLAVL